MNGDFEERYGDVLQNIEFGIVQVYREHREMTDWHAESAVEALIRIRSRDNGKTGNSPTARSSGRRGLRDDEGYVRMAAGT
jgi:hypothetical protein